MSYFKAKPGELAFLLADKYIVKCIDKECHILKAKLDDFAFYLWTNIRLNV